MSNVLGITFHHSQHVKFLAELSGGGNIVGNDFNEFIDNVSKATGRPPQSIREAAEIIYGPQPKPPVRSLI